MLAESKGGVQCYCSVSGMEAGVSSAKVDAPGSGNCGSSQSTGPVYGMSPQPRGVGRRGRSSVKVLKSRVINELSQYCGRVDASPMDLMSWPASTVNR